MLVGILKLCGVMNETEKVMLQSQCVLDVSRVALEHSVWFYISSKADFQGGGPASIIRFLKTLQRHGVTLERHSSMMAETSENKKSD